MTEKAPLGEIIASNALINEGVQVFDEQQHALDPTEVQQLTPLEVAGVVGHIAERADELSHTNDEKVKIIVAAVKQAKEITGDGIFDERLFRRDVVIAAAHHGFTRRQRLQKRRIIRG